MLKFKITICNKYITNIEVVLDSIVLENLSFTKFRIIDRGKIIDNQYFSFQNRREFEVKLAQWKVSNF